MIEELNAEQRRRIARVLEAAFMYIKSIPHPDTDPDYGRLVQALLEVEHIAAAL